MMFLRNYYVNSSAKVDIHLITHDVKRAIRESEIANGMLLVLVTGATAGVKLMEEDPKLHEAYRDWVLAQIPDSEGVRPNRRSGSGRESAHLRAALVGSLVCLPVQDGRLMAGSWQEVVLFDFDDKIGRLEITAQILGDSGAQEQ